MAFKTREEWLREAMGTMATEIFKPLGHKFPSGILVSCGFPHSGAFGTKKRVLGECWYPQAKDPHQLFISPVLVEPLRVLDVLAHEMTHPIAGKKSGHHGQFKRIAIEIGLTGKMTSTVAGPELEKRLNALARALGKYPHVSLTKMTSGKKKQGTRMIKLACPECEFICRASRKAIEIGLPTCVCGWELVAEDSDDEGGDE